MTKFQLIKKAVKSVHVHWSESMLVNNILGHKDFDIEKEIEFNLFCDICDTAISKVDGGYDKTKVTLIFHNGDKQLCRFDLGDFKTIEEHINAIF